MRQDIIDKLRLKQVPGEVYVWDWPALSVNERRVIVIERDDDKLLSVQCKEGIYWGSMRISPELLLNDSTGQNWVAPLLDRELNKAKKQTIE